MTLQKNESPDWAAAGLDYVGGDRPRSRGPVFPFATLESVAAADVPPEIKAALENLKKTIDEGPMCKSVITPTPADDYAAGVAKELAAMHEAEAKKVYKMVPVEELELMKKTLEEAHAALHETPEIPKVEGESVLQTLHRKKFDELRSDLFDVRKDFLELRSNYRHNLARVFAAGALVAWVAWQIFGGPS